MLVFHIPIFDFIMRLIAKNKKNQNILVNPTTRVFARAVGQEAVGYRSIITIAPLETTFRPRAPQSLDGVSLRGLEHIRTL